MLSKLFVKHLLIFIWSANLIKINVLQTGCYEYNLTDFLWIFKSLCLKSTSLVPFGNYKEIWNL